MKTQTKYPGPGGQLSKKVIERFRQDFPVYGKTCLKIRTKDAQIQPFELKRAQRIVHEVLKEQFARTGRIRAIILKARQEGMSTLVAGRFFRKLHLWTNQEGLVIADEKDRASTIFTMYERFAALLPPEIQPMSRTSQRGKQLEFDNPRETDRATTPGLGSKISVETAGDTNAGRGSTLQLIHATEMAFWPNAADVYTGLKQAMPMYGSELIVESTANGIGNLFHQMWKEAEEGEGVTEGSNGFVAIFLPWWIHEEYTLAVTNHERDAIKASLDDTERAYIEEGFDYRGKRHKLTYGQLAWRRMKIAEDFTGSREDRERAFRQEFPATAEEAFIVTGNCFFDEDKLKLYDTYSKPAKRRVNIVRAANGFIMKKAEMGYLRVWEEPYEVEQKTEKKGGEVSYVIAADTASGKKIAKGNTSFTDPESEMGGRDFSCADVIAFGVDDGGPFRRQVAQLWGRMAPEIFAEQLHFLGHVYSNKQRTGLRKPCLLVVEANHSSGETVLQLLDNGFRKDGEVLKYPNLYRSRRINRVRNRPTERLGWLTTVETRMPMLDNLARAFREESITIPNKDTIKECFTFVRGDDGKPQAQEGSHDDRVIALAIGLYIVDTESHTKPKHYDETEQLATTTGSPTGLFTY